MDGISRRDFGVGLATTGITLLTANSAFAATGISIPATPMLLSRKVTRGLGDGNSLSVYREWMIEFAIQGRGFSVSGTQTHAKVDAPENLAAIAQIEESRSTDKMWPILLSSDGQILGAGDFIREEDLAAAVQAAEHAISQNDQPAALQIQQKRYLAQMHQAGSSLTDQLPPDLFFPAGDKQDLVRTVNLPEGGVGEFSVSYKAKTATDGPWLSEAMRKITTRIGKDTRESSEEWHLNAI
ncbi:hypothetical protein [Erythrobacter sp. F6033]|uniref:hypothetical protein n=1 Tax=Erythrobacter sp. F6033 TaxID=2926401 RepID=UPI001FF3CFF9|nr:hypothetical protein [Erythrobacter sp. F6033]MCK0129715.1 hypothetical protein [Erythrobacter sp. F6033]